MVKHFYNRIADRYDKDWRGIYKDIHEISLSQITEHFAGKTIKSALDLAVGTGNGFNDLSQHLCIQHRIGNDISEEMLNQAKKRLKGGIELICDDALNIRKYVADSSQDLILCQFLLSYLDGNEVLKSAYRILKPGGVIALASSTKRDLLELHTGRFRVTNKLFRVGEYLNKVDTPMSHEALLRTLTEHKLQILKHKNYRKQVVFESFDDVTAWAIDSGWAAQYFDSGFKIKTVLGSALFKGLSIIMYPLYPVYAHNDISVILAQRSVHPQGLKGKK